MGLISRVSSRTYRFEVKKNMADLVPFTPMVSPANFGSLASLTVLIGFLATASFFVYEVTSNKYTRDLKKEITSATFAAVFDGLAALRVLGLWTFRLEGFLCILFDEIHHTTSNLLIFVFVFQSVHCNNKTQPKR